MILSKKIIVFVLALSMLVLGACSQKKKDRSDTSFIYTENENGSLTIIGYSGLKEKIEIPSEINGKKVTALGENSFRGVKNLKKVVLPDTVTAIDYAFIDCASLNEISLSKNLISMSGAFIGCTSLTNVNVGNNVIEMSEAFMGCTSLKKANIPAGNVFAAFAFKDCTSLTEVSVGEGVTSLNHAFENCTSLKTISVPSSVVSATSAFENCTSLEECTGITSLTSLNKTFKNCASLKELTLGSSVKEMKEAFVGCSSLTSVQNLPVSAESYSPSFSGCSSMKEIIIPKIENDDDRAAYDVENDVAGCSSVEKLSVLTSFLPRNEFCKTFSGCSSLKEINFTDDVLKIMLRFAFVYEDKLFTGTNSELSKALNGAKKVSDPRLIVEYGTINGKPYTRVNGYEIGLFEAEDIMKDLNIIGFKSYQKSYYWCGFSDGDTVKNSVGIERVFTFYPKVTGKNDGSINGNLIINGMSCKTQ